MARNKARARDTVRSVLSARDAHGLTKAQRAARARNRDLQQLKRERHAKAQQLAVLDADIARLDAQIALAAAELDTATTKL